MTTNAAGQTFNDDLGSGTAFPTTGVTAGVRFFRTDLGLWCYWDGTRWLSINQYVAKGAQAAIAATNGVSDPVEGGESFDHWIETLYVSPQVAAGGTALDSSNKWVLSFQKVGTTAALTNISAAACTVASGASDGTVQTPTVLAINALMGTGYGSFKYLWTKTGTPGALTANSIVGYRLVLT